MYKQSLTKTNRVRSNVYTSRVAWFVCGVEAMKKKKNTTTAVGYIPRQFANLRLYPWQQDVLNTGNQFNDRVVDCIIDQDGCIGKSTLAGYASLNGLAIDLPSQNEGLKLIQSACNILSGKQSHKPKIIFFDMPRAQNKHALSELYSAIEELKKGRVYDFRHKYTEWWFDSPRIWVFTNAEPQTKLLSPDRWRFWKVVDNKLVSYYSVAKK